jgi:hypothetical protein
VFKGAQLQLTGGGAIIYHVNETKNVAIQTDVHGSILGKI